MRHLFPLIALLILCPVAAAQVPDSETDQNRPPQSEAEALIRSFFDTFNSGDPADMISFYEEHGTADFRSRRSDQENRELFEMLHRDMGRLELEGLRLSFPEEIGVMTSAERMGMPVRWEFELKQGKLDGFSVQVGGGEETEGPVIELPRGADDETVFQALDESLQQLTALGEFAGVVLLSRQREPVFHRAYGEANRATGHPNRIDTRFDVGSITKLMTRVAVAQLLQSGRLRLEGTIAEYLPDYPNPDVAGKVTVEHLLDHSSGLGDIFNERWDSQPKDDLRLPRDFFPLFVDQPLQFEPGERRSYSNAGFTVLGALIEAASGISYPEYLERNVFAPAGMTRSGFPLRDGTIEDLAIGYTTEGEGGPGGELRPNLGMLPPWGCPAGSSSHTAEDLLKLDRSLRSGDLLDPDWTAWVYTGAKPGAKPGTESSNDYFLGVAGGGPGVSAGFESDGTTGAIVLSNLDPPMGERLALQLHRALNGE